MTANAIDFLSEHTADKRGDVRIARETLLRSGELVINSGDKKVELKHIKEKLNMAKHTKAISVISELSTHEKFILRLIPKEGVHYPQFYRFYKSTDGKLGNKMLRNYMKRFSKLKLVNMQRRGVGDSYFITLNMPKDVLFN